MRLVSRSYNYCLRTGLAGIDRSEGPERQLVWQCPTIDLRFLCIEEAEKENRRLFRSYLHQVSDLRWRQVGPEHVTYS